MTKGKLPRLSFAVMKDKILGKNYNLSVAFVPKSESKKLNKIYRNKDYPTDILAFPLNKKEGEIVINLDVAKKKAEEFGKSEKFYLNFLFIHGLLHLKGMDHGSTMERKEQALLRFFGIK